MSDFSIYMFNPQPEPPRDLFRLASRSPRTLPSVNGAIGPVCAPRVRR